MVKFKGAVKKVMAVGAFRRPSLGSSQDSLTTVTAVEKQTLSRQNDIWKLIAGEQFHPFIR